jgi:plastocyanin
MRRLTLPLATALLAVILVASPVAAATRTVTMDDGRDFSAAVVLIARGDYVRWRNDAQVEEHDVFATQPHKYFSSGAAGGMGPGDVYTRQFRSAGSFEYVCRVHDGMNGRVTVPMSAGLVVVSGVTKFRITVATASLPSDSPFRHYVEVDPPGTTGWTLVSSTRSAIVHYTPRTRGSYDFRTRVKRVSGTGAPSYSDAVYKSDLQY